MAVRGGLVRARKCWAPHVSCGPMPRNLSAEPGGAAMEMSRCCQLKERERIRLLSEQSTLPFWPGADSRQHPRLRLEQGKAGASLRRTPVPWRRQLPPDLPACPDAGVLGFYQFVLL